MKKNSKVCILKICIMLLFFLFFVLTGCVKQQETAIRENFKQGFGEVKLEFDEKTFPQKIYQNSPLSLALSVKNNAAYDVRGIGVSLVGFDNHYVELQSSEQIIDSLEGRSTFNPAGGQEYLVFNGNAKELLPGSEYALQNILVYLKYNSLMEFSPTVCINPSLHEIYDAGCAIPSAPVSFKGQGAPLAVGSMNQVVRAGFSPEIEFRLSLRNKGQGKIKRVAVKEARLGSEIISCQFRNADPFNLQEIKPDFLAKEMELLCVKKLEKQQSYLTTLFVSFDYDYELSLPKSLRILR